MCALTNGQEVWAYIDGGRAAFRACSGLDRGGRVPDLPGVVITSSTVPLIFKSPRSQICGARKGDRKCHVKPLPLLRHPDRKYQSILVQRLINKSMLDGKNGLLSAQFTLLSKMR